MVAGQKRWNTSFVVKKIRKVVDLFLDHADPQRMDARLYDLRGGEEIGYDVF